MSLVYMVMLCYVDFRGHLISFVFFSSPMGSFFAIIFLFIPSELNSPSELCDPGLTCQVLAQRLGVALGLQRGGPCRCPAAPPAMGWAADQERWRTQEREKG